MTRIIWIVADDLGWGDVGCQGHPTILTPNIDALAAAGTRFTHYRSLFSVCSPSRCTLITGQSAAYNWIDRADIPETGNRQWLPSGATTIQRCLKTLDPAPHTMHLGKWHLGTPGDGRNTLHPNGFGIDYFFGSMSNHNSVVDAYERQLDAWVLENRQHIQTSGYITTVYGQRICDWLDEHGSDPEGFLIAWWDHMPHVPLDSTVPEMSLYPTGNLTDRTYYASVSHLDTAIGAVLAKLTALGIADDVHIIFSSDNGPNIGSGSAGGLRGGKNSAYEGGIRVPFIWKGPGIPSGVVDTENRLSIDFFPTVAGLFGFDASGWPGSDLFDPAPQRDQLIAAQSSDALIRSTIGDGRTIKLLEEGATRRFYCIDATNGELLANALTVVASGATAGQLNQSDADSIEAEFDAQIATYPEPPPGGSGDPYGDVTEEEARQRIEADFAAEPRPGDYRVHMCGTVGSALQDALEALVPHPYTIDCAHSAGSLSETALGTLPSSTHPSTGTTPVAFGASKVVSGHLHALCFDPVARANCDAGELAEINARLATTSGDRLL